MNNKTNVIVDKKTNRVIIMECNGVWVFPSEFELYHYENGVEPIFKNDKNGNVYLKPNCFYLLNDL